jgi:hypothetical protein
VACDIDRDALAAEDLPCGPLDPQDLVAGLDPVTGADGRRRLDAQILEHGDGGVQSGDDAGVLGDEAARRLTGTWATTT